MSSSTLQLSDLERLVLHLDDHLCMLNEEGLQQVALSPAVIQALGAAPRQAPTGSDTTQKTYRVAAAPPRPRPETRGTRSEASLLADGLLLLQLKRMDACKDPDELQRARIMAVVDSAGLQGEAGELLTNIFKACGLERAGSPLPLAEAGSLHPDQGQSVLVTFGERPLKAVAGGQVSLMVLRGKWRQSPRGWRMMPTFDPSYCLQTPTRLGKAMVWADMQAVLKELGLEVPEWVKAARKK